jgi:maltose-binding protein MalE
MGWQNAKDRLTKIDDKVYSFPFCVEGRGLIYSKKAIEDILGTEFDPATINSYDSLKALLESLRAGWNGKSSCYFKRRLVTCSTSVRFHL